MASTGGPIAPPAPGQPVPKEYIKHQLRRLGIRNVSEDELEYYAAGEMKMLLLCLDKRLISWAKFMGCGQTTLLGCEMNSCIAFDAALPLCPSRFDIPSL